MNEIEWPKEYELISFFGSISSDSQPADGFWCYEVQKGDVTLRFSFDIFERSIQIVVEVNGIKLETVSHEGINRLRIESENRVQVLRATFESQEYKSEMELRIDPNIQVKWFSLRKR